MADLLDPKDLVTIEELAVSGMWEMAGLVEVLQQKGTLKKQEILDAIEELRRKNPLAPLPKEPLPKPSRISEIEQELIGDVLALFDAKGLTREQALTLLGQFSILVELVKWELAKQSTK
jgi:hypothetical protein